MQAETLQGRINRLRLRKLALIPDNRLNGLTNLGGGSFTILALVPALAPFFAFGLLALLSLLFFLAARGPQRRQAQFL
jgi:hypothetical protein